MKWCLAAVLMLVFAGECAAFRPSRARRNNYRTYNTTSYDYSSHYAGDPSAVAAIKARRMANLGYIAHFGGGYGGANAEGVGSGMTPGQALNNCCFTGQRVVAGQCVVQGANGMYYACKLYW